MKLQNSKHRARAGPQTPPSASRSSSLFPGTIQPPVDARRAAGDIPEDSPVAEAHDPFAALRVRAYRLFAAGWLPSSIGLQMQATALAWEIYERTHDPMALGLAGVARAAPTILLALPAGQIVDRLDRRRVLLNTQVGFAAAAAALMFGSYAWEAGWLGGGRAGLWVIYLLIALTGGARVFNGPSRSSLLPLIIPGGAVGPIFHNAATWNSAIFQLAAILGPVAAGGVIALTHRAWPVYALCGAGCLWFAGMCVLMAGAPMHGSAAPGEDLPAPGAARRRRWAAMIDLVRPSALLPGIMEGARHVWREKTIFGAIALDLLAVLFGGATALMPMYASDILHVGPVGLGALRAAPFVGALVMALALANRRPFERAGITLLGSVAGFAVCTIVFGLSTWFPLSLLMLAGLGALDNISVVVRSVLVSVRTPDELRGRVAAVNSVFIESSNELGGFESGLMAKYFGPVFSVVSGGIGTVLVVLAMAVWIPQLRRLKKITA